jgi:hypothetical protein
MRRLRTLLACEARETGAPGIVETADAANTLEETGP